jgi:hypothetical protein
MDLAFDTFVEISKPYQLEGSCYRGRHEKKGRNLCLAMAGGVSEDAR